MQETTTITLPFSPTTLAMAVAAVLLAVVVTVILISLAKKQRNDDAQGNIWTRFLARIGFADAPPKTAFCLSVFWAFLALTLTAGIITTISVVPSAFFASAADPADYTLRWTLLTLTALTGALGAVVALPFTLIRIRQTQRQNDLREESLFNDKINAAATDLAAQRQVTRVIGHGAKTQVLTEWNDDLVTRATAIDRLEGLALERADVAPRIARMLSIYVQELSRTHPAKTPPENATPEILRDWAQTLNKFPRTDMERAVQSLARINPLDKSKRAAFGPKNIDLRQCNLQGFRLRGQNLQGSQLDQAQMQGADLVAVKMNHATLSRSEIQGTDISSAEFINANLTGAQAQGAIFNNAKFQGARLDQACLCGASLTWSNLQGTGLRFTELRRADLFRANLQHVNLEETDFRGADLSSARLQGAKFGRALLQGAVLLGANMQGTSFNDTKLRGAKFSAASMHGALLQEAGISKDTYLATANLRGAAVRFVDESTLDQFRAHSDWEEIFHPNDDMNNDEFVTQWRAFAASLDPPVTIAPDYRP